MEDLLTSKAVQRVMHVARNGLLVLTTTFEQPVGDLAFWQSWLQHIAAQESSHTFAVTFCDAEPGDPHKCEHPIGSEYSVSGLELTCEPDQLIESIQLESISRNVTVDSLAQPQILTIRAIVRIRLTNPEVEISTWRVAKLNLWSGQIKFAP